MGDTGEPLQPSHAPESQVLLFQLQAIETQECYNEQEQRDTTLCLDSNLKLFQDIKGGQIC